jgi:spore germination cell wall hydrolase CwlJ-like protein
MSETARPAAGPLARVGELGRAALTQPKGRLVVAGFAVGLLVLAIAVAVSLQGGFSGDAQPGALRELPGRPDDIEKHGGLSETTLAPDDARARNARVGFVPRANELARPFAFSGTVLDRQRATECLAAAVLYEAGIDSIGQSAVAQVVLNRVRHPAYPGTVCGVVFQGSQRKTGCQFTFTCDGSMTRRQMSEAAWSGARAIASAALAGAVDKNVGLATHYHTDWVYPYWSPSLRKLAQVGTHLFFGWPGGWGAASAFAKPYRGNEPTVGPQLALPAPLDMQETGEQAFSHSGGEDGILGLPQAPASLPHGMGKVPLYGTRLRLARPDGAAFGLLSPPGTSAAQMVNAALSLCGKPGPCRVNAWDNEDDIPGAYPLPVLTRSTMVFEYVREGGGRAATIRFDCARFPNRDPKACLESSKNAKDLLAASDDE